MNTPPVWQGRERNLIMRSNPALKSALSGVALSGCLGFVWLTSRHSFTEAHPIHARAAVVLVVLISAACTFPICWLSCWLADRFLFRSFAFRSPALAFMTGSSGGAIVGAVSAWLLSDSGQRQVSPQDDPQLSLVVSLVTIAALTGGACFYHLAKRRRNDTAVRSELKNTSGGH